MKKAAERAANLTRQLLAFSRRQVLRPEIVDVNQIVRDAEKMLKRLVGEDIEFSTTLTESMQPVLADPGQLEQVLMNLVINARDAMTYGGPLNICTKTIQFDEDEGANLKLKPGIYAMISVQDGGTGIEPKDLQHIFEPFFTTKEQGKGTGLGLATVYGIVRQSGGVITVDSQTGLGSTFKVYLPCVTEAKAITEDNGAADAPHGQESILLVEDEEALRDLTKRILEMFGYQVTSASSGEAALQLFASMSPTAELLLTDVVMPGMSGPTLARRILDARPGLRVLYMSGYTDEAIAHHGVLEIGVHLINKPFSPATLAKSVREALDATP